MTTDELLIATLLSIVPISELRGAIPYAIAHGMSPVTAYVYCVMLNAVVGPLLYLFLSTINKLLLHLRIYRSLFNRVVERSRRKLHGSVQRYGYLGILLFVAIPLPMTGAYTGTLGAWVLGLEPRRTFLAVLGGVAISGVIVVIVAYFGIEVLSFVIKH
ncbi:MAG TPA: small multi-drug export protein [Spirochaetia bacterium]|nr:small multi-drug export protein [Spirochaetia bacterium]